VWESSSNYQKQLNQSRAAWDDQIVLSRSTDGGHTWIGPTVIHTASGLPTFTPTIAVNAGRIAVTYYDNRNLGATQMDRLPTNYWVRYSTDRGASFPDSSEQQIGTTFDAMTAPIARGFFLGDYEGLQPSGNGFLAVYAKTNCDAPYPTSNKFCEPADSSTSNPHTNNTNPTDVFSAILS